MKIVRTTSFTSPEHFSETDRIEVGEYSDREHFLDDAFGENAKIIESLDPGQDFRFAFVGVFEGAPRVLRYEGVADSPERFMEDFNRFVAGLNLAALPSGYRECDLPQIDVQYETEEAHAARLAEEEE